MKFALLHRPGPSAEMFLRELRAKLPPQHDLIGWTTGESSPAQDIEVLLVEDQGTRAQMASQPKLALVHTASAGYEGINIDAATPTWVSGSCSHHPV